MSEDTYHLGIKALITDKSGNVLLLKVNPAELTGTKNADYWDLPGGRVQQGNTVEETLKREVEEEIGAKNITVIKPVGMVLSKIRIPLPGGQSVGLILGIYECALPNDADVKLSKEHVAAEWFPPHKAAELLQVKYPPEFCQLIIGR